MRTDRKTIIEIERLLEEYEIEVKSVNLADNTVRTYLYHANSFVRWCKGDFEPGGKKMN